MGVTKPKRSVRTTKKAINAPLPTGPVGGEEMGSTCGHSNCGSQCQVRYVGPTSHLRDQHIIHAARGASQVWTAAIVAGLAVVLTGAIAYSAVQAAPVDGGDLAEQVHQINLRLDRMEGSLKALTSQCRTSAVSCGGDQKSVSCTDRCRQAGGDAQTISICVQNCGGTVSGGSPEPQTGDRCEAKCKNPGVDTTGAPIDPAICLKNCRGGAGTGTSDVGSVDPIKACLIQCSTQATACTRKAGDSADARKSCTTADQICRDTCRTSSSGR